MKTLEEKKEADRERNRLYRKAHPEHYKSWCKAHPKYFELYNQTLKREVLSHYSRGCPRCAVCGNSDLRVLSIDHICGGGYTHYGEIKWRSIYGWLKKNDYPEGYQVLCMNCQWIKRVENNECKRGKPIISYPP